MEFVLFFFGLYDTTGVRGVMVSLFFSLYLDWNLNPRLIHDENMKKQ